MRFKTVLIAPTLLVLSFLFNSPVSEAKPYKRAVIFSGGGYQFSQFLGVMEALEEAGKKPDLIIASCGGGLAAALVANLPTAKMRRDFIMSPGFKNMLRSTNATPKINSLTSLISWLMRRKQEGDERLVPSIFEEHLVNVPDVLPMEEFNRSFSSSSLPVVIVGAKVLFSKEKIGHRFTPKEKLYREVLFTSPDVARYFKEVVTSQGTWTERSSIESKAEVVTDISLTEAARAAISSPFFFRPAFLNGEYYVGGTVNLYPLELAKSLADEVITSFGDDFSEIAGVPVVKATYQFNPNERLQNVNDMYADYWIDNSDRETFLNKKTGFGLTNSGMKVYFRMPADDVQFDRDVMAHFNYGKSRALEALSQKNKNAKCHMRTMNSKNSSWWLRQMCRRG